MDFNALREYCLSKKGAAECFPFDNHTLVFKVGNKMFALTNINSEPLRVNLKCDPLLAEALRQEYDTILPGYHMHKKYWNTVIIDGSIPDEKLLWMIDMSYDLILKNLPKLVRKMIEEGE